MPQFFDLREVCDTDHPECEGLLRRVRRTRSRYDTGPPLRRAWSFWVRSRDLAWNVELAPVATQGGFRTLLQAILSEGGVPSGFDLCLFRKGLQPSPDDVKCAIGGIWTPEEPGSMEAEALYRVLADGLAADELSFDDVGAMVCGVVLRKHSDGDEAELWTDGGFMSTDPMGMESGGRGEGSFSEQIRTLLSSACQPALLFSYAEHSKESTPESAPRSTPLFRARGARGAARGQVVFGSVRDEMRRQAEEAQRKQQNEEVQPPARTDWRSQSEPMSAADAARGHREGPTNRWGQGAPPIVPDRDAFGAGASPVATSPKEKRPQRGQSPGAEARKPQRGEDVVPQKQQQQQPAERSLGGAVRQSAPITPLTRNVWKLKEEEEAVRKAAEVATRKAEEQAAEAALAEKEAVCSARRELDSLLTKLRKISVYLAKFQQQKKDLLAELRGVEEEPTAGGPLSWADDHEEQSAGEEVSVLARMAMREEATSQELGELVLRVRERVHTRDAETKATHTEVEDLLTEQEELKVTRERDAELERRRQAKAEQQRRRAAAQQLSNFNVQAARRRQLDEERERRREAEAVDPNGWDEVEAEPEPEAEAVAEPEPEAVAEPPAVPQQETLPAPEPPQAPQAPQPEIAAPEPAEPVPPAPQEPPPPRREPLKNAWASGPPKPKPSPKVVPPAQRPPPAQQEAAPAAKPKGRPKDAAKDAAKEAVRPQRKSAVERMADEEAPIEVDSNTLIIQQRYLERQKELDKKRAQERRRQESEQKRLAKQRQKLEEQQTGARAPIIEEHAAFFTPALEEEMAESGNAAAEKEAGRMKEAAERRKAEDAARAVKRGEREETLTRVHVSDSEHTHRLALWQEKSALTQRMRMEMEAKREAEAKVKAREEEKRAKEEKKKKEEDIKRRREERARRQQEELQARLGQAVAIESLGSRTVFSAGFLAEEEDEVAVEKRLRREKEKAARKAAAKAKEEKGKKEEAVTTEGTGSPTGSKEGAKKPKETAKVAQESGPAPSEPKETGAQPPAAQGQPQSSPTVQKKGKKKKADANASPTLEATKEEKSPPPQPPARGKETKRKWKEERKAKRTAAQDNFSYEEITTLADQKKVSTEKEEQPEPENLLQEIWWPVRDGISTAWRSNDILTKLMGGFVAILFVAVLIVHVIE